MLSGRASVYIDPSITGEDQEERQEQPEEQGDGEQAQEQEETGALDRSKFGKHLGDYGMQPNF